MRTRARIECHTAGIADLAAKVPQLVRERAGLGEVRGDSKFGAVQATRTFVHSFFFDHSSANLFFLPFGVPRMTSMPFVVASVGRIAGQISGSTSAASSTTTKFAVLPLACLGSPLSAIMRLPFEQSILLTASPVNSGAPF